MADTKITGFTASTLLDPTDLVTSVADVAGTPVNRKMTGANLAKSVSLIGAGALNNIASATPDLSAATTTNVTITGTTTITALGTVTAGAIYNLTFAGALTLTHNGTSLILPSGANVTTAAGDVFTFQSLGSGNWRCLSYALASGEAIVGGAGGGSADATVNGTDDAATDLSNLNTAITAVSASATAPKTIAIVGTFAMGATRPSQLQYITLDLTRAYMKQTANFTDAAPWLRGIGMQILGGKFGSALGAVAADNSIVFGDTTTAGDGPLARVDGAIFDATWDSLTAARTVISTAATSTPASYINVSSICANTSTNRLNVDFGSVNATVILRGNWLNGVLQGSNSTYLCDTFYGTLNAPASNCHYSIGAISGTATLNAASSSFTIGRSSGSTTLSGLGSRYNIGNVSGATVISGTSASVSIGNCGGNVSSGSGDYNAVMISEADGTVDISGTTGSTWSIGHATGAVTCSASTSVLSISQADSTISTASSDGCSFTFGTVTGVLTASGTDGVYNIGTLVAASQVLSGANNTYNIGECSSSVTCSGTESSYRISKLVGAGTFSATKSNFDVATADSTITTASGDGCTYRFGTVTGVLTASGTDSAYQIGTLVAASQVLSGDNNTYDIGEVSSSITCSGSQCVYSIANQSGAPTYGGNQNVYNVGYVDANASVSASSSSISIGSSDATSSITFSGGSNSVRIGRWNGTFTDNASNNVISAVLGSSSGITVTLNTGVYDFCVNSTAAYTFNGAGSTVRIQTNANNDTDLVVGATCVSSTFLINAALGSGGVSLATGATGNVVDVISDVTPVMNGDTDINNIVYWQRYSASPNYPKYLVSHKGPNRIAQKITAANITALGGGTTGQIALSPDVPARGRPTSGYVMNRAAAVTGVGTMTASIGLAGDSYIGITTAATVFASNATSSAVGTQINVMPNAAAATTYSVQIVVDTALSSVTGMANGLVAVLQWD